MTTDADWIRIDPAQVASALRQEAVDRINRGPGEVTLDFSSVPRIDTNAAGALEELAGLAKDKSVKLTLRAVNGDIYKALKLLKLTERFSFVD